MNLDKFTALKRYFGYSSFRKGQDEIIDNILSGNDVLAVMPTGAGKSLCFQIPALITEGTTVVISPLISLMKDQITALCENGIPAATINSSLDKREYDRIYNAAINGRYKLIYVSPERLLTDDFLSLCERINIPFVCVDEAHCVSQWGQDFRSSYLNIPEFVSNLKRTPVLAAFTATATGVVRYDIIKLLKLNNPIVTVTGFDRKNLYFEVQKPEDKFTALRRCLDSHSGKSTIVYCSTRKRVNEVCEKLISLGYNASKYHAGLLPDERKHNQELFVSDKVKIMVATNAFGMGIDKSDVSLVVHYNMPGDIESYYQEAGRAGRDGSEADCILLYSYQDVKIQEYFINNPSDNENMSEKEIAFFQKRKRDMLRCMEIYCQSDNCLRHLILRYFGESVSGDCENCSVCCGIKEYTDITVEAQKVLSAAARTRGECSRNELAALLHGEDNAEKSFSHIKTFGAMKDSTVSYISKVIECLISNGYMNVEACGDKEKLYNTERASCILFDNMKLSMKYERDISQSDKSSISSGKPDLVLFTALKVLRQNIASRLSLPPLAVFTDYVLREMSTAKPTTLEEMRNISGMSESKVTKYAPIFLKEINEYIKLKK